MNRLTACLAIAAAALLLAACSAAHAPASGRKIVATVSPAGPQEPVSGAAMLKSFRVGPLTQEFGTPLPASTGQRAVLAGFRAAMLDWTRSDYAWRNVAGTTSLVTGSALRHLTQGEQVFKDQGIVLGGTDRFFKTKVIGPSGATAVILTCDDTSRDVTEFKATGKIDTADAARPSQYYIFATYHLALRSGRWAIAAASAVALPQQSARQCQPSGAG